MNCPKANGCRHYLTGIGCMVCENENNFKPLYETNYDRLMSKSPAELAAWIASIDHDNPCPPDNSCSCSASNCTAGWLDWLQREAET